jgi:hypothetical protein
MKTTTQIALLWMLQMVGNAGLLALFAWWLQWPDSGKAYLAATGITAVFMLFAGLWLHCGALACFAEPTGGLGACFRKALRRLPAFLSWVLVVAALVWGLLGVRDLLPQAAVRLGQVLHLSPRLVFRAGERTLFGLQWIALPALLWPFAFAIAGRGFGGWRLRAWRCLRRGRYWLGLAVALGLGLALPYKLIHWELAPGASLAHQKWSAGLRFFAAYLLCVSCWLALGAAMRRREAQVASGN